MHSEDSVSVQTLTVCHCGLDVSLACRLYPMKCGCEGHWESCGRQRTTEQLGRKEWSTTDRDGWRLMVRWLTSAIVLQGQWQRSRTICVAWGWISFRFFRYRNDFWFQKIDNSNSSFIIWARRSTKIPCEYDVRTPFSCFHLRFKYCSC